MSPLVGVAVLEGKTGLSEARELLGKLWDGRSGTCRPSGLEVNERMEPRVRDVGVGGYCLGLVVESSFKS